MSYKVGDRVRSLTPAFLRGEEATVKSVADDYIVISYDRMQSCPGSGFFKDRLVVSGAINLAIEPVEPPIQVGDFVRVVSSIWGDVGDCGRVIYVSPLQRYAVEFAQYVFDRHSCDGKTMKGHGRFYESNNLEVVNDHT